LKTDAASQLLVLVRPPRRDLFPFLFRAEVMAPLVVLFALIPILVAFSWQQIDTQDAVWGLRALTVATSKGVDSVLLSETPGEPSAVGQSTPLAMWLTAATLFVTELSVRVRLFLPSYLATFALLIAVYGMLRTRCGARLGLIAALLLAFHLPVLTMVQDTTPIALSLLFAVIALWGITSHLNTSQEIVSLPLLWGGIGLGLCLLTSIPIAALVLATTFVWIVVQPVFHLLQGREWSRTIPRLRQGCLSLVSLLVFCVTALAVGGWWELLMYSRGSDVSWWRWDAGLSTVAPIGSGTDGLPHWISLVGSAVSHSVCLLQALIGLSVIGFACLCRSIFLNETQSSKSRHRDGEPHRENTDLGANHQTSDTRDPSTTRGGSEHFLFVWFVVGLSARIWGNREGHLSAELQQLGTAYVMIPAVVIAAHGLDQIARRRVKVFFSFLAVLATVLLLLVGPVSAQINTSSWLWIIGFTVLAVVGVVASAWWAGCFCHAREPLERRALITCLSLLVISNGAIGIHSVGAIAVAGRGQTTAQDRIDRTLWHASLHQCGQPISQIPLKNLSPLMALVNDVQPVKRCTLVSQQPGSSILKFVLRSLSPDAEFRMMEQIEVPPAVAAEDSGSGGDEPQRSPERPRQLIVFWGRHQPDEEQWNAFTQSNPLIKKLGPTLVLQQHLLSCYLIAVPQPR